MQEICTLDTEIAVCPSSLVDGVGVVVELQHVAARGPRTVNVKELPPTVAGEDTAPKDTEGDVVAAACAVGEQAGQPAPRVRVV